MNLNDNSECVCPDDSVYNQETNSCDCAPGKYIDTSGCLDCPVQKVKDGDLCVCPDGKYDVGEEDCENCYEGCKACDGPERLDCRECNDGLSMDDNHYCVASGYNLLYTIITSSTMFVGFVAYGINLRMHGKAPYRLNT